MRKIDIGIPRSLTSETGMAVASAENLILAYEIEGKKILKAHGLPVDILELYQEREKYLPDLANGKGVSAMYSAFWMLHGLMNTRLSLSKNDTENAVINIMSALNWAAKLQIKVWHSAEQSLRAARPRKRNGITPEEREKRNKKIITAWEKTGLTLNSFATIQAKENKLSITQIKNIVKQFE